MRIFIAFSTGAMMGRILAKLLKRKNVDMSNRTELNNLMSQHPEELKQAQELVKEGGVFEKFISDTMLDGIDPSYKTQFINWTWVALADSNEVFDMYVKKFGENGITADTHHVTGFIDKVVSFCNHMKKHADFKQRCREILNKVSAKADHVGIEDFYDAVDKMDAEWDSKKKYIVNDDTVAEAWENIERNEVHVDGDWGEFKAYRIPSWEDLMQTCNRTNWCVAQKGSSGQGYYRHYGVPYYLICDRRHEPFALLNPPSRQFKDVKDYPITIRDNGSALPTHRRAIRFGLALLKKVAPNVNLSGDFDCFKHIADIDRLDEQDRNDRTDYDAEIQRLKPDQSEKNTQEADEDSNLDSLIRRLGDVRHYDVISRACTEYEALNDSEKNAVIDRVLSLPKGTGVHHCVISDCAARDEGRFMKLLDKNVIVCEPYNESVPMPKYLLRRLDVSHSYRDYVDDWLLNISNFDPVMRRLMSNASRSDMKEMLKFALMSKNCSQGVVDELMKMNHIEPTDGDMLKYIMLGMERGVVGDDMLNGIVDMIRKNFKSNDRWSGINGRLDMDAISNVLKSSKCPESLRDFIYNQSMSSGYDSEVANIRWTSGDTPLEASIESMDVSNPILYMLYRKVQNTDSATLDSSKYALEKIALKNQNCPKEVIDNVLESVEYGKYDTVAKNDNGKTSLFACIFASGKVDEQRFMKILKTNPKLVARWGWNSPYCTDAVKLALVKKIGKTNGFVFRFNENENPLVVKEFYKTRTSVGRYGEYLEAMSHDLIPDEMMRDVLMKVDENKPRGRDVIARTCNNKKLSAESMEYIYDHRNECKTPFDSIGYYFFMRRDIPESLVEKAINDRNSRLIDTFLNHGHDDGKWAGIIAKIADVWFSPEMNDNHIRLCIVENKQCPVKYLQMKYEDMKGDSPEVIANAIRNGMFPARKFADDIGNITYRPYGYSDGDMLEAILDSTKYTDDEKTMMMLKLDFSKVPTGKLEDVAKVCTGKPMFKKIALFLNHSYNNAGVALAQNQNYGREQIAAIVNRCYGVAEGYYNRFGVDDVILRSKHLYKIIDEHYSDFSRQDAEKVLGCGNEDAVWLLKKYIRDDMKIHSGVKNASRLHRIAMRMAYRVRLKAIAFRLANEFMEE